MRIVIAIALLVATAMIARPTPAAFAQIRGSGSMGGLNRPPPAADVAKRLGHPNLSVRRRGAEDLWRLGPGAKEILPTVQKALADDDHEVRVAAAMCLARFDSSVEGIVPVLVEALEAATSNSLIGIVRTLVKLDPARTPAAVERLIAVVRSDDRRMRPIAFQALAAIGPPAESAVPALIEALQSDDVELQRNAATALARIGAREAIPDLLAALRDDNPWVRENAAVALLLMKPITQEVGQALLDFLKIPDTEPLNSTTARLIGRIAPVVPDTLEQLIAMTSADHEGVRYRGADALAHLGTNAPTAVPALLKALKDENRMVRCAAARALGAVAKPASEEVVAALAKAMKDPHPNNRAWVVMSLAGCAGDLPKAQAILIMALEDKDAGVQQRAGAGLGAARLCALLKDERAAVRASAARALAHLFPRPGKEAAICLIETIADCDADVRRAAVQALGRIAMPGVRVSWATDPTEPGIPDRDWVVARVVPAVARLLGDSDSAVRAAAAAAAGSIGAEADSAVGQLTQLLGDSDALVRENAARAHGSMGTKAQSAGPALARALRDKQRRVRWAAARALGDTKPRGDQVLAALVEALNSPHAATRENAASAMGRTGPAVDVAPLLVRALKDDPDVRVRQSAAYALGRLGASAAHTAPALVRALRNGLDGPAVALIDIGKQAPEIAPLVIKVLEDDDRKAVRSAVGILHQIGATSAAPALIRLAGNSRDGSLTDWAVEVLADVGPDAKGAVSVMVGFDIESGKGANRDALAEILRDIGPAVVPKLVEALKDDQPRRRQLAARALGDYGAGAKEALPALRAMVRDDNDPEVQAAASEAIEQISPERASDDPI